MKNRIIVVTGNNENTREKARDENINNIRYFGILQEFIQPDNSSYNFQMQARRRLEQVNKVSTTIKVELFGDDRIQKGVLIPIRDDRTNNNRLFVVRKSKKSR